MDNILSNLSESRVFENFEKLTKIPRESGNEKAVSDFIVEFAKKLNLEVIQEPCNNVIIKKPASKGYENGKTVILQGHLDMVCVKLDNFDFDFEKDSIPLIVEGDYVKTKGTTLGADNGIAVAMAMTILESQELEHPPLVALFTVAEETGMDGVLALDPKNISGDILINIDSEEEGTLLASCAGGVNNIIEYKIEKCDGNFENSFSIIVSGLKGGHSGMEINKSRANAIKLMGRILRGIDSKIAFEIFDIAGGEKMNAIAKRSEVKISISNDSEHQLKNLIDEFEKTFRNEFSISDPDIQVTISEIDSEKSVFTENTKKAVIGIINLIPFGVESMSAGIEGLVESSNNLGVLAIENDAIVISSAVRSSVKSLKEKINEEFSMISELTGAKNYLVADYPEWQFKEDSPIRDIMKDVYKNMYGKEVKVDAIHAGLECGFLKEKLGDIDMVSLGPNLYDVHTPFEKVSISSTERVYNFLCEVLKKIK